jgi:hypothetical protein
VIIPGFGGFVANYMPARLDELNNRIFPPSKHLLFNKNLINNDGLLAHRISAEEEISYESALERLTVFVDQIKQSISNEKRFEFPDIGLLFIKENTYQFKSTGNNFLISSFGLPVLDAVPFSRVDLKQKIEEETPVINLQQHQQEKAKRKFKYWWVAAVLIPFVFYSVWIPMKTQLFKMDGEFHYSDLNPFSFRKDRIYEYNSLVSCVDFSSLQEKNSDDLIVVNSEGDQYGKYFLDDSDLCLTVKLYEDQDVSEVESTYVHIDERETSALTVNKKYFLIGGCFKKEKNADNFMIKLQSMGYEALEVDVNNGLHRIAISGYNSRKKAKEAKRELLEKEGISSWILKKK